MYINYIYYYPINYVISINIIYYICHVFKKNTNGTVHDRSIKIE